MNNQTRAQKLFGNCIPAAALIVGSLCASTVPAASEIDWKPDPANLTGLDGVGVRCIVSSDRKFVHRICKSMIEAVLARASNAKLKFASAGVGWERVPDDTYRAAIQSAEIENPLLVEIFVRGTDGSTVSGSIHILASIEYEKAMEQGSDQPPRSGRLLIWENAKTARGPVKQVPDALSNFMAEKLDLLFDGF